MRCNQKGIDIIKMYEGLKLQPYLCPAGLLTVGYGSTLAGKLNRQITREEAEQFLKLDVEEAEKGMSPLIKIECSENEWSALVSFVFNVGVGNFKNSTLLKVLNQRDKKEAANQFARWVFAAGKILPGLQKRRDAEKELFLLL